MTDLPVTQQLPLSISSFGQYGAFPPANLCVGTSTIAAYNWPASKQAVYIPVAIPWPYPVARVFWANGSTVTNGNYDFGIYTIGAARLYHTGSTLISGASQLQYVTPTPFLLSPGLYYFALAYEGTVTLRALGSSTLATPEGKVGGFLQQAEAFPLPEKATFAAWASTGAPICGVTRTASGF